MSVNEDDVRVELSTNDKNPIISGEEDPGGNDKDDQEAGEGPSNEDNKMSTSTITSGFSTRLQEYEELFKDRYTQDDQKYVGRVEEKIQPLVVHPWIQQEQGNWNRQSNDRNWRGNQRGGRWNNQQRPQYDGNRRQYDNRNKRRNDDGGWADGDRNKRQRY